MTRVTKPRFVISTEQMILDGKRDEGPTFRVTETARTFFARSGHWIRLKENQDRTTLDGVQVATRRSESEERIYTLGDIELLAHALAQNEVIGADELLRTLVAVKAVALVHGVLDFD